MQLTGEKIIQLPEAKEMRPTFLVQLTRGGLRVRQSIENDAIDDTRSNNRDCINREK